MTVKEALTWAEGPLRFGDPTAIEAAKLCALLAESMALQRVTDPAKLTFTRQCGTCKGKGRCLCLDCGCDHSCGCCDGEGFTQYDPLSLTATDLAEFIGEMRRDAA